MNRRLCVKSMLSGGVMAFARAAQANNPIELHVDLSVDPAREDEMLHNFKTLFLPAARKQPGFIEMKMLKLRSALQGSASSGENYRFVLTFASEDLRREWVASATHKRLWPTVEKTLSTTNYRVLLYDRR